MFLGTAVLAAVTRPLPIIRVIVPYMFILALFAGFVVWNGGVVLGEEGLNYIRPNTNFTTRR
jgi:alpha-1,2-glucosyltransferase